MRNAFVGILVVCAMSCAADTISFSVPVLSVRSDGTTVIEGSGTLTRCPFIFSETTNATPVKVAISEDVPVGVGNWMRASVWLAVTTASLVLNRDLSGETITIETSGFTDGPSAGGMFCLAVMTAIEGRKFPDDFAMTGTIMADGTIGPVGGISEKLRAASRNGIKRVCIPTYARIDDDSSEDLLDLGRELNLEMHQVATVDEAYRILHRLPARHMERLNPVEVCRLPASSERAMKNCYTNLAQKYPSDDTLWNEKMKRSSLAYRAGLFGVGIMDILSGLHDFFVSDNRIETPPVEFYPALEHPLPTNEVSFFGIPLRTGPDKASFITELQRFHRDLKSIKLSTEQTEDKVDDYSRNACGAQVWVMINHEQLRQLLKYSDLDRIIDSVENWNDLDVELLNSIRYLLIEKSKILLDKKRMMEEAVNVYRSLAETIPSLTPNSNILQVEKTIYSTMRSMEAELREKDIEDTNHIIARILVEKYRDNLNDDENIVKAILSEVQALSWACTLSVLGDAMDNPAFFSSIVSTTRENALLNIEECKKLGIPCVMPIVRFQQAEFSRDAVSLDDEQKHDPLDVFRAYLEASISAKTLILCFSGQKPELNAHPYPGK